MHFDKHFEAVKPVRNYFRFHFLSLIAFEVISNIFNIFPS